MNHKKINALTLASIFSAIYVIISILASLIPILDLFVLIVMPIFAAYYSCRFKAKETILFNISCVLLCFLFSYSDPFYAVIYILPTLIIGDIFGILIKHKVSYYVMLFTMTFVYLMMNVLSIYLTDIIYIDSKIIEFISLLMSKRTIIITLYLVSLVQAYLSQVILTHELKKFAITVNREKDVPSYNYWFNLVMILMTTCLFFIDKNVYFIFYLLTYSACIASIIKFIAKIKYKAIIIGVTALFYIISLIFIGTNLGFYYCTLFLLSIPLFIQIVFLCQIMYNFHKQS